MVNNWLTFVQRKLIPPRCILCGNVGWEDLDLCAGCRADLPRNLFCCDRCGERFQTQDSLPKTCGKCLQQPPGFDQTCAPYIYSGPVRYLISQLKFRHDYKCARLLAKLLADHKDQQQRPECLVPVPLFPDRYRERGFNQAIEIGRHLASELELPLDLHGCVRIRDTGHQASLPAKARRKNMKNAFAVVKPLGYRHVAIIDDVMTTGATASALATELKKSGVERVDVWICARA